MVPDYHEWVAKKYFGTSHKKVVAKLTKENELLAIANDMDLPTISVALCLHPWAVMEYDPQLEVHKRIMDSARSKGFEIKTYGQVADLFKPKSLQQNSRFFLTLRRRL